MSTTGINVLQPHAYNIITMQYNIDIHLVTPKKVTIHHLCIIHSLCIHALSMQQSCYPQEHNHALSMHSYSMHYPCIHIPCITHAFNLAMRKKHNHTPSMHCPCTMYSCIFHATILLSTRTQSCIVHAFISMHCQSCIVIHLDILQDHKHAITFILSFTRSQLHRSNIIWCPLRGSTYSKPHA